jgi:hypothetical protein
MPPGWHVERVAEDVGYSNQYALIISNEPFNEHARARSYPTLWDMSRQPRDLVAVMLGNAPEARVCGAYPRDAAFPYTERDVTALDYWFDDFGWPELGSLYGYNVGIDRQALAAYLWLGREASEEDLTLGAATITTIGRIDGWSVDCRAAWQRGWSRAR